MEFVLSCAVIVFQSLYIRAAQVVAALQKPSFVYARQRNKLSVIIINSQR